MQRAFHLVFKLSRIEEVLEAPRAGGPVRVGLSGCRNVINNRAIATRQNYSRWRRPGNWKVKISDSKINFFLCKHFLKKLVDQI